jgi:hypothetical protein
VIAMGKPKKTRKAFAQKHSLYRDKEGHRKRWEKRITKQRRRSAGRRAEVICRYCGEEAQLMFGRDLFGEGRRLERKRYWVCERCDARVGCHGESREPMGELADASLRKLRSKAHKFFDRMWQQGHKTRNSAYFWLAEKMGLTRNECHIANFDEEDCRKVIAICQQKYETASPIGGTRDF